MGVGEDTNLSVWLERNDSHVRIYSKLADTAKVPHLEHSQWLRCYVDAYRKAIYRPRVEFRRRWLSKPAIKTPEQRDSVALSKYIMSDQNSSWIDIPISFLDLPQSRKRDMKRLRITTASGRPATKSSQQSN